ncbi:octopamine receptor beta-1R-like [Asterias amurensis]|uniref:octopamine receptor beta-1R-like n=1 Tax=Asterias amurensis TaxID=7602 RepID=UPI003AB1835C
MEAVTNESGGVSSSDCVVSGDTLYQVLRASYIGIDFILTLFGNILTIIVTRKVEEFSDSTKIFITSLAVADLGVTVVAVTSFTAEVYGRWPFPEWICQVSFLSFYIFTAVSVIMIVIMTVDRLVAVVKPLRHSLILTKRRSIVAAVCVWFCCILSASSTTFLNTVEYNECSAICWTKGRSIAQTIASVMLFYITPLICILIMNIRLLMIARRHALHFRRVRVAASLPNTADQPKHPPPRNVRGKAVGVISLVTLAFALSWSVYQVCLVHSAFSDGSPFPESVEFVAVWLGLTNSWWNVIIYSIMNRNFRNHLKSVLLRLFPWFRKQEVVNYRYPAIPSVNNNLTTRPDDIE